MFIAGIYSILSSLVFLHDRVGVCHNNVALSSIFVTSDDGAWKLGALDHLKTYGMGWALSSPRKCAIGYTRVNKYTIPTSLVQRLRESLILKSFADKCFTIDSSYWDCRTHAKLLICIGLLATDV